MRGRYPQKDLTYFTPSCGDCYGFGMNMQDGASMLGRIDASGGGAKLRRVWGSIRALACAGVGATVLLTASCSGSSGDIAQPLPSSSTSAGPVSSSASPSPAADAALAQYEKFWSILPGVSAASPAKRRAMLQPVAADPELSSLLRGMRRQDANRQRIYGRNLPRATVQSLSEQQRVAVIRDCQDSSHSGVEKESTHQPVTVGTARNLVVTTMRLGDDDRWRVSYVTYPKSKC